MNFLPLACLMAMLGCDSIPKQSNSSEDSTVIYAGTTPCGNVIRPIFKIKEEPDCPLEECQCIMVEWELILYLDANTSEPTRFKLKGINRHTVKETNMYSEPGVKSESEGTWKIERGTKTNPSAIFYQLNPGKPGMELSFIKLGDNLLHVVDQNEKLMIGNEFFSYSLNRILN